MKIYIKAKPGSKKDFIKQTDFNCFEVSVREVPEKGMANKAIMKLLSKYLKVAISSMVFVSGEKAKLKIFEIPLTENELRSLPSFSGQYKLFN